MFSKRQRSERTELVQTDPSLLYQGESDFHLSVPAHHTLATLPGIMRAFYSVSSLEGVVGSNRAVVCCRSGESYHSLRPRLDLTSE